MWQVSNKMNSFNLNFANQLISATPEEDSQLVYFTV